MEIHNWLLLIFEYHYVCTFLIIFAEARIFDDLLFGTGLFPEYELKSLRLKHLSSSTEDLIMLFQAEKSLIQDLKQIKSQLNNQTKTNKIILQYLNEIDYNITDESLEYVFNPINALHLLKRLSQWIPRLKVKIPKLKFMYNGRSLLDDYKTALHGMVEIQEYFDLDTNDLAKGWIKDFRTGKVYQSNSNLTSNELYEISKEAKNADYLNNYVDWLTATLEQAIVEKSSTKYISKLRKNIQNAKIQHDKEYMEYEWDLNFTKPPPKTNDVPYYPNEKSAIITKLRNSEIYQYTKTQNNLIPEGKSWVGHDVSRIMDAYFRRKVQDLCRGIDYNINNSYKGNEDLNCIWLHHNDPYLKLGPFKFEIKHQEPEIGLIHEFASLNETKSIQDRARGQTKSTPYGTYDGSSDFSKQRTSKVMYMNEKLEKEAMVLSKKIELATHFRLYQEDYASENYQVMNYGIAGKISPHIDYPGIIFDKNYKDYDVPGVSDTLLLKHGGPRIMTFMIYLSDVEAGGYTTFPQPNISVKPNRGTALFWFNMGAQNNYDSRIRHLGCPVLYGNKWIANKWVKWLSNFRKYPCLIHRKHYSILLKNK